MKRRRTSSAASRQPPAKYARRMGATMPWFGEDMNEDVRGVIKNLLDPCSRRLLGLTCKAEYSAMPFVYHRLAVGDLIWDGHEDMVIRVRLEELLRECNTADIAEYGAVKILAVAHALGSPWHDRTMLEAAWHGHLKCLQYAHEHGCPWNGWTTLATACNGHLDCLQYACENGCPLIQDAEAAATYNGHTECATYIRELQMH